MENSLFAHFRFAGSDPFRARWDAIRQYNAQTIDHLPTGAKEFVAADWHYNYMDPRCPHDSWLQSIEIQTDDSREKIQAVEMRLLGAFHDRLICFQYKGATDLSIEGCLVPKNGRNLDWLYDEVHLCDASTVEHIIEFEEAVARIECVDLRYSFTLSNAAENAKDGA
jgi:hypothetical protein